MARYKVPSQAASGADTFSDSLVGNQFTTGSDQMTGGNFAIDRAIPEKDSKTFITEPFSNFVTLDTIGREEQPQTSDGTLTSTKDSTITFNNDKNNADRSLYGSLRERLGVEVQDIITKYPAAFYVDGSTPVGVDGYTALGSTYNSQDNTTTFKIQYSLISNPLDVVIIEPQSNTLPVSDNNIRNFFSAFTKYVVEINSTTYSILTYSEPNTNDQITLKVVGDCFNGTTGTTENYIVRPNNGVVEEFYRSLNDIQTVLLNRTSDPIFNAGFDVPKEGEYDTEITTIYANWPISRDGWNIQTEGVDFASYINRLSSIGEEIDGYKSNLVVRFLTSPQLYEFDTEERKMEAIFQIYGQSFDLVKKFIDNIAYMRNVSYDGINNLPDALLKNLCETLGLSSVDMFDENSLDDALYTRHNTQYAGIPTGTNLIEAEFEFYRRILVNLAHLYKSKGTRNAIEFFLKFIGAPEPMIRLDEYVYKVNGSLPSKDIEGDIANAILGTYVSNSVSYNTGTGIYDLVQVTGSTTLTRQEYPVDDTTGLPRKINDPTGEMFFEKGAGWYRRTLDHRSPEILDEENSDLTSRVKTIKTKAKPFTYGEDYFDTFRTLPGLDYGYDLTPEIDNKKSDVIDSESEADRTLNRKNINVFLSGDRGIDYDIYRKSRNIPTSFSLLTPQTGVTFAEFLETALNNTIPNANMVKYDKFYTGLTQVYYSYMNTVGFTPYHYVTVEEFINKLSPYWVNIIEQFVPATTLWLGGTVLENGTFNRSKFQYRRPPWFDVEGNCDMAGTIEMTPCPTVTPSSTPAVSPTPTPTPTPGCSVSFATSAEYFSEIQGPTGMPIDIYTRGAAHSAGSAPFIGGVLASNGNVIFVPYNGPNVGKYNPVTDTYTSGAAHGEGNINPFCGGVLLPNCNVIFAPQRSAHVGIYNPITDTYTSGDTHGEPTDAFRSAVLAPNGKVILIPCNSLYVGIYDPDTDTYTRGPAHGEGTFNLFSGGVLLPNGNIIFVPSYSLNVGIYNPTTNTYTSGDAHGLAIPYGVSAFRGGVLAPNGNVIFVPSYAQVMGIYNPTTDTFTTGDNVGTLSFYGGVLAPSGKMIFAPSGTSTLSVGIYDPVTDTYTNGAVHGEGFSAFAGAVLVPSGNVILVPLASDYVGIYDPDNSSITQYYLMSSIPNKL